MSLRFKLLAALVALVIADTAVLGVTYINNARDAASHVSSLKEEALDPLVLVEQMQRAISELQSSLVNAALDDDLRPGEKAIIAQRSEALQTLMANYAAGMAITSQPRMREILKEAGALESHLAREADALATISRDLPALTSGIADVVSSVQARNRQGAGVIYNGDVAPRFANIQESVNTFAELQAEQGDHIVDQLVRRQQRATRGFAATAASLLVVAVIGGLILSRNILRPVSHLVEATEQLSRGDLSQDVGTLSTDEIGQLGKSFQTMIERLRAAKRRTDESTRLLTEREGALNEAQEIAALGSWTWDFRDYSVSWSPQLFRNFGLEPDAIVPTYEAYLALVHPEDRALVTATVSATQQSGQPFDYQHRVVLRDGTIRVSHARGQIVTDAHGTPIMMAGTAQDVTARVEAETAVKKSEERFQLAMRATNDAVWDWDLASNAIWWNDAFSDLFGYRAATVLPTLDFRISLIHPDDRELVVRSIEEFLSSERVAWTGEYRLARADGSYAWVCDRGYLVRDQAGAAVRMIGSMMDVTSRKQADRMKSDFVSFVSHQLRTPLSGMNWMLELASDTPHLPAETREYIVEARASAHRLVGLVNDLLDISRLESGRLALALEPVRLDALTESILAEVRSLVDAKGQRVVLDVAEALGSVYGDEQLLRQAVANLLSNAIKYSPDGGTMRIGMTQTDGVVRWQVKDSGIGIPKSAQPRLFQKFFRADNAVATETEGTGLGLHLVRLVVDQFGGQVWCESEEGQGATFGFSLPAMEAV